MPGQSKIAFDVAREFRDNAAGLLHLARAAEPLPERTPRVRILEIVSGKQPNGAVLQCIALIRQMLRRGHQLTLVCRPGAWIAEELAGERIEIIESDLHR